MTVECQNKPSWNFLSYFHGVTKETREMTLVKMTGPRNESRNNDLPNVADVIPLMWTVHLAPCGW